MDFSTFANYATDIEATESDTEIISQTAALLGTCESASDLRLSARFVQGEVFPGWDSRKLDIGDETRYEALAKAASGETTASDIESRLAEVGEIGAVAEEVVSNEEQGLAAFGGGTSADLTLSYVHSEFEKIAAAEGKGSKDTKVSTFVGLLNTASALEARYLTRLVGDEMRIGVGGGTVRDAIAKTFSVPIDAVADALQVSNDYGDVAVTARKDGEEGLADFSLEIGRPVDAMLAQAGTISDGFNEWDGRVAVDWKFDGARVQIHTDGDGETSIYSRRLEEVTPALPEVVEYIDNHVQVPAVIDGEVVPVDEQNRPEPFQEILRRFRRKHNVEKMRDEVQVKLVAFDLLYVDNRDLLKEPLSTRHNELQKILPSWDAVDSTDLETNTQVDVSIDEVVTGGGSIPTTESTLTVREPGAEEYAHVIESQDDLPIKSERPEAVYNGFSTLTFAESPEEAAEIERAALEAGHEGIMLKNPDAAYTPGKRGKDWLKQKPDVETLDVAVTGAEWGEGRRADFLGTFMLSVRDGNEFRRIGKVATGITDEKLDELTELLEPHITSEDGQEVDIEPAVILEIGYEEIQESPEYESGFGLRFPRFVEVRDDIDLEDVDTVERVTRLSETQ